MKNIKIKLQEKTINLLYTNGINKLKNNHIEIINNFKLLNKIFDNAIFESLKIGYFNKGTIKYLINLSKIYNENINDNILFNNFSGEGFVFPFKSMNGQIVSLFKVSEVLKKKKYKSQKKLDLEFSTLEFSDKMGFFNLKNALENSDKTKQIYICTNPTDVIILDKLGIKCAIAINKKEYLMDAIAHLATGFTHFVYISNDYYDAKILLDIYKFLYRKGTIQIVPGGYLSSLAAEFLTSNCSLEQGKILAPFDVKAYIKKRFLESKKTIFHQKHYLVKCLEYIITRKTLDKMSDNLLLEFEEKFNESSLDIERELEELALIFKLKKSFVKKLFESFSSILEGENDVRNDINDILLDVCNMLYASKKMINNELVQKEIFEMSIKNNIHDNTQKKYNTVLFLQKLYRNIKMYYKEFRNQPIVKKDLFLKKFPDYSWTFEHNTKENFQDFETRIFAFKQKIYLLNLLDEVANNCYSIKKIKEKCDIKIKKMEDEVDEN